ncbi:hypothetical protein [Nonomuraea sp. NPDC049141]|uniref:hypothetical protein n=1 Tax=Nonomuraea sp. NPDC049141 TaxID=3155500 RepID=UPI0033E26F87
MSMPGDYERDLSWVEMAAADRAHVEQQQAEHEEHLLTQLAADYIANRINKAQLYDIFDRYHAAAGPGSMKRWNRLMPITVELIVARRTNDPRHTPSSDGTWSGAWPLDGHAYPPRGQAVVYVLFDGGNVPCYVGSTSGLIARLQRHANEGKRFNHWIAHPCADREAAYRLEDRLLREHKPYLNQKASR